MSDPGPRPVFLERPRYRQRRLMEAARVLPLVGMLAFLVPLLWPLPGDPAGPFAPGDPDPVATSEALTYLFAVWAALIAAAFLLSLAARAWSALEGPHPPGAGAPKE